MLQAIEEGIEMKIRVEVETDDPCLTPLELYEYLEHMIPNDWSYGSVFDLCIRRLPDEPTE
jgi:hypothetical protein